MPAKRMRITGRSIAGARLDKQQSAVYISAYVLLFVCLITTLFVDRDQPRVLNSFESYR